MELLWLIFDMVGTIAFAVSGTLVGIGRRMDIFGMLVLALATAIGGGIMRDLIVGNIPPKFASHRHLCGNGHCGNLYYVPYLSLTQRSLHRDSLGSPDVFGSRYVGACILYGYRRRHRRVQLSGYAGFERYLRFVDGRRWRGNP